MSALPLSSLRTGLALATSWTWCIGMFAPIVIGRMFGWWGIVAFAVPNILGCALFGYLRSRRRSLAETRDHAWAMAAFSVATVAYQVFFAGWIGGPPLAEAMRAGLPDATTWMSGGVFLAAAALSLLPRAVLWNLAAFAWIASAATFAFLPWGAMHGLPAESDWNAEQLLLVLPTIAFGFMLSPNLDLTFHRGRQMAADDRRPVEFAVFGGAFGLMLVLTVGYLLAPNGLVLAAVRTHILVQLVLTSAMHLSELRAVAIPRFWRHAALVGAGLGGLAAALAVPGESTYMRFLGLYGLLFPAYAALALRTVGPPRPLALAALAVAMAAVTPILDRSFLDGPTLETPLAVVVPLLAIALFARRTPSADQA